MAGDPQSSIAAACVMMAAGTMVLPVSSASAAHLFNERDVATACEDASTSPRQCQPAPASNDRSEPLVLAHPSESKHTPLVLALADVDAGHEIDAAQFFTALINRYRHIGLYEDTTSVVQVINENGTEQRLVRTQLSCEIDATGELHVRTPGSGYIGALSELMPMRITDEMRSTELEYSLWLAPHMSLVYDEAPLQRGRRTPVTPVKAETTKIDDRTVVQLRLSNQPAPKLEGSNSASECNPQRVAQVQPCRDEATVDLFVNPESMLIERIESDERLPDGRHQRTTIDINPRHAGSETPPAVPSSATAAIVPAPVPAGSQFIADPATERATERSDEKSECNAEKASPPHSPER